MTDYILSRATDSLWGVTFPQWPSPHIKLVWWHYTNLFHQTGSEVRGQNGPDRSSRRWIYQLMSGLTLWPGFSLFWWKWSPRLLRQDQTQHVQKLWRAQGSRQKDWDWRKHVTPLKSGYRLEKKAIVALRRQHRLNNNHRRLFFLFLLERVKTTNNPGRFPRRRQSTCWNEYP